VRRQQPSNASGAAHLGRNGMGPGNWIEIRTTGPILQSDFHCAMKGTWFTASPQ